MHQQTLNIKIIKLVNGDDIVCHLPTGKDQLTEKSPLVRLDKPLVVKYVPQMTASGFKDYIALIIWCSYTPDKVITIPKDKIMTITNASGEMITNYNVIANQYDKKPMPVRKSGYERKELSNEDNMKINELFDEFDDDDGDWANDPLKRTIH